MDTLWAPWRMVYIDRSNDDTEAESCVFCLAAGPEGEADELVVHRVGRVVSLLNRYPYNPGHLLVAPVSHGGDLGTLDPGEFQEVAAELQLATRVLQLELGCDGFNGGWNQGRIAGAGIAGHLHFHLVPRWSGDTNFMPVLADVKVIPEHLEATRAKLRAAFRRHTAS